MKMLLIFSFMFVIVMSIPLLAGNENVLANKKKPVVFSISDGDGGCSNCENAVRTMLNDPKKRAELTKIFPKNSKVIFYVREPKGNTNIFKDTIAIIVGSCASDLQSKGNLFIPGCRRQIDSDAIYKAIVFKSKIFTAKAKETVATKKKDETGVILRINRKKVVAQPDSSEVGNVQKREVKTYFFNFPHTWSKWLDIFILPVAMSFWSLLIVATKPKKRNFWIMSIVVLCYFGFYRGGCPCPLGSVGGVTLSIAHGTLHMGFLAIVFFLTPLLFALLWGRVFCSSACPIGAIQQVVSWKHIRVPQGVEAFLCFGKYIVLFLIIYAAGIYENTLFFCKLDPFINVFRFSGSFYMSFVAFSFIAMSVFVTRPFCRWFCPYAILLRIVTIFSLRKRRIVIEKCIECKLCEKECPMQCINVPEIDVPNCVMCDKCRVACPKNAIK
jgi:formate hydrogenlyase subunit 6/NADH:ubiquinone oxidoreductase subunit I